MADFFKGLSGGFQTGLQISEALRAKQERERLREAMGLTPQEMQQRQATPEELGRAQAETQGIAAQDAAMFGLSQQDQGMYAPQMPVEGQRIGATQYGLGGQTYNRMPTQQEIETARYGAAANVIAERDPVAAMRMRREMEEQAYQAQRRPLELAGLERQAKLGDLQVTEAERAAATAKRMESFNAWRSQNPQAGFSEINAEVQRLGMGVDEQFKVASSLTGIGEQEFKASQQRIQKLVKNQGLDGLLKAHKESNDLDPGSHFEVIRGKGGSVSLNRVDTATGQVIQPNVFSGSEAETTAYLNKAAMDPATIIDYTMNLEKNKSALAAQAAQIRASDATVGLRTQQQQLLNNQAAGNAEAQQIRARYDALTSDEQIGPAGQGLVRQFNMANAKAGMAIPLGTAPKAATGPARELSDLDKENLRYYRDWVKDPKNAKLPQGQKDAYAAELGVTEFIKRGGAGPSSGLGADVYAAPQQGVNTTRPAAPAPAARPAAMRGPSDLSTVDIQRIRNDAAALDAAIAQAQAQASAVVRSGDTTAIKLYGDRLNTLRAQRQALTSGLTGPAIQSVGLQ